jgi:hypothetical protein
MERHEPRAYGWRMRRLGAVTAVAIGLTGVSVAPAAAPAVRCSAGRTVFRDPPLRVFAVPLPDGSGAREYACLMPEGQPVRMGIEIFGGHPDQSHVPTLVFDGERFAASVKVGFGEGGAFERYTVADLERGRVVQAPLFEADDALPFRLAGGGRLLVNDGRIRLFKPRSSRVETLSRAGVRATRLAVADRTAYWTIGSTVEHATVPGSAPIGQDRRLSPARVPRRPRCGRGSLTLQASPSVRVFLSSAGRRSACRLGQNGARAIEEGEVSIAHDRWVLTWGWDDKLTSLDTRTGRLDQVAGRIGAPVVLVDGTLVWTDEATGLMTKTPGSTPEVLADGSAAPSSVATSGRTVYWLAAGVAHSWTHRAARRVSASR